MRKKINNSKVLIIGAGGLGCPLILYLANSGVGNIGIVDDDKIEISNLRYYPYEAPKITFDNISKSYINYPIKISYHLPILNHSFQEDRYENIELFWHI